MSRLQLSGRERTRLHRQLQRTRDAGVFRRTLAVLHAGAGRSVTEIADWLGVSRMSVHEWIARYRRARSPLGLWDHRGGNHPSFWTEDLQALLRTTLAQRPDSLGYQAVDWTVPLLQEHLARLCGQRPGANTVRRELHRLDFVWKRPRYRYQPDPERDKKTPAAAAASGLARPHGLLVRGRNRPVVVSALAEQLGPARHADDRRADRSQRAARGVRHNQCAERPPTVPGPQVPARR